MAWAQKIHLLERYGGGDLTFHFNFWEYGKYIKQFDIPGDSNISFHLNDTVYKFCISAHFFAL